MAHYAKVLNNEVVQVMVAEKSFFESFIDTTPGEWLQCSYNTRYNQHPDNLPLRGNYPSKGFEYNKDLDIFLEPKPHNSWVLDEVNAKYKAPIDYPTDGASYYWDESTISWVENTSATD